MYYLLAIATLEELSSLEHKQWEPIYTAAKAAPSLNANPALDIYCSEVSRQLKTCMHMSYENEDIVIHAP
jgi:hypothetical protein